MNDVHTWIRVLLGTALYLNLINCQCSNEDPEVIFNDNLRLKFCGNTFEEFNKCICQDNSETCGGLYERAENGQYWFMTQISNIATMSESGSDIKYYRCHVPLFFSTGSFMCNKLGSMIDETYRVNKLCADGDVATMSWSYFLSIETRNWLNDSSIEPVTMTYPETSAAAKTSRISSNELEESTASSYGSLTQLLQTETSTGRITSKTPGVVSDNPYSSYSNSVTPSLQPETSAGTATSRTSYVVSESPVISHDTFKTTSLQQETSKAAATSKTLFVSSENTETGHDYSVTPTSQPETLKDTATLKATSVGIEDTSISQDLSQASTLNPQTAMDTETSNTFPGQSGEPTTDQHETRMSTITDPLSMEKTSVEPSVEPQGSTTNDDDDDIITPLVIGCSVAGVLLFVIMLLVVFCVRRRRERMLFDSFTSEAIIGNFQPWTELRGKTLESDLISNKDNSANDSDEGFGNMERDNETNKDSGTSGTSHDIGDQNTNDDGNAEKENSARIKHNAALLAKLSENETYGEKIAGETKTIVTNEITKPVSTPNVGATRISVPEGTIETVVYSDVVKKVKDSYKPANDTEERESYGDTPLDLPDPYCASGLSEEQNSND